MILLCRGLVKTGCGKAFLFYLNINMEQTFNEYRNFIGQVDAKVEQLTKLHANNMKCGKGCDLCCLDFSVFPVEFYHIRQQIANVTPAWSQPMSKSAADDKWCALLENHACSIYPFRPYICRTHGLPLIYLNDEADELELSFCELNFTAVEDDYFDMDNVWEQDDLNSELFMINKRFLENNPNLKHDEITLIPLRKLMEDPL